MKTMVLCAATIAALACFGIALDAVPVETISVSWDSNTDKADHRERVTVQNTPPGTVEKTSG